MTITSLLGTITEVQIDPSLRNSDRGPQAAATKVLRDPASSISFTMGIP